MEVAEVVEFPALELAVAVRRPVVVLRDFEAGWPRVGKL